MPKTPRQAANQPSPLDNPLPYPADELAADLYHCIADAEAQLIRLRVYWAGKDKDMSQLTHIGAVLLKASTLVRKLEWPSYDTPEL